MCQGMEVDEWIDKQQENVLDVPYFHTVFTVPEELYSLIYSNQKLLYDALYHAAYQTMAELSADPKHLGARIGYICVLHTWGSRMNYHSHLRTIVLGGGLDAANTWKDKGKKFFFPVKVMSAVFKKYYLRELKQLWEEKKLEYHGTAAHLKNHYEFKTLLNSLYDRRFLVDKRSNHFSRVDTSAAHLKEMCASVFERKIDKFLHIVDFSYRCDSETSQM